MSKQTKSNTLHHTDSASSTQQADLQTKLSHHPVQFPSTLRLHEQVVFTMHWRALWVCLVLVVILLSITTISIQVGEYPVELRTIVEVLTGGGTVIDRRVVLDVRLGRCIVGILVGAALGLSGALTQAVARNPLASPDVLGITNGASLAAVCLLTFASTDGLFGTAADAVLSSIGLPLAAICGALITASLIWVIAGSSRSSMIRFVLIGVAAATMCSSLTTWVMAAGNLDQVAGAKLWLTGSLNGRDFTQVWPTLVVLLVGMMACAYLTFPLSALALGETTATILGHRVRLAQALQLITAVILAGVAVAAAGPIAFVAFLSPHIARWLAGTATPPLITSACVGAVLVSGADLLARTVVPWELPVGIVTTTLGAPMLVLFILSQGSNKKFSRLAQKNT